MTKIIELRASNFARLSAVEIRPNGALVAITGKNTQGKTSVLKAIWTALKGRAVAPPRPIKDGAERAMIKLDLGQISITRTFRRDKHNEITTDLIVSDATGGKVAKSPQALIDAILGDLTFDPLAFARLPEKDQIARLKQLVRGIDFEALAHRRQVAYDERTDANRRARESRVLADRIQLPPGPAPARVDLTALANNLQEVNSVNARIAAQAVIVASSRQDAERLRDQAEEWRSEAAKLTKKAQDAERIADSTSAEADRLEKATPARQDATAILGQMAAADRVASVLKAFQQRSEHEKTASEQEANSEQLTSEIESVDRAVRDAVAMARLPAGLGFSDATVTLDGKPFSEAGTADKIIASMEVGMALNPDLRVILIDEGSELDEEHLALVAKLAAERDFQVWCCKVQDGEAGVGFRIEDGRVAVSNKEAAE